MSESWIKLLSGAHISEFTPEMYHAYIRTLYHKPEPKAKKPKKTFIIKLTKTGKVSLQVRRDPKWITRAEIEQLAKESGIEERLIYLKLNDKKRPIELRTEAK